MPFPNLSSFWFILICLSLPLLNRLPTASTQKKCGHINSCDRVISYAVFQRGACGRMARCYWELDHVENALEGKTSSRSAFQEKIREALCLIPTLGTYEYIRTHYEDKSMEEYQPCDSPPQSNQNETKFAFYPVPTLYTFTSELGVRGQLRPLYYLKRMSTCATWEERCNKRLQATVDRLCDLLDKNALKKLEDKFQMKIRRQKYYKLAVLHPDLVEKEGISFSAALNEKPANRLFNNCSLLQFRRKRYDDGERGDENDGVPTFEDSHGFNNLAPQIRSPYFDLYLLYAADPLDTFKNVPKEDRWWNETKAYQQLAHYLPEDMLQSIHDAIKCIYDKVDSPHLVWKPEKFCWGYSTFICVEKAMLKGNTCNNTIYTDERHEALSLPVP